MGTFRPDGDQPKWRVIYDLVAERALGDMIPYAELSAALGYDVTRPRASRAPIYAADRKLLRDKDRTLVNVKGEGYRVARGDERHGLAVIRQKSARRKIRHAISLVTNVEDRSSLSVRQQEALDALGHVLMQTNAMFARHDVRITGVESDVRRVDDRIEVLERTLALHGIEVPARREIEGQAS
jgi:hypothetical protein